MDLLSDILSLMRLTGTLYFRTSFTAPWGVKVPPYAKVSRFHFAHQGRCLVRISGVDQPVTLEQGDLIIITQGAAHTLYCTPETEDDALPLEQVVELSGFDGTGALVYGPSGTNLETQLICGHFAFDPHASHPLIDALPPYIRIERDAASAGNWLESTLRIIGAEAGQDRPGSDLIALNLSEIIFAQALRIYLSSYGAELPVLAGFADINISRALEAIHRTPEAAWTLEDMAKVAGLSRTSFATKFSQLLAMTPQSYLTHWRMQIAREQLSRTNRAIIDIAESVGYQSEAAFGRVYKKAFGVPPARYRRTIQDLT